MMMQQIKLFFFVLGILYLTKFLLEFIVKLFQENPEPIKITNVEKKVLIIAILKNITLNFN